jgi:hypothetical protein
MKTKTVTEMIARTVQSGRPALATPSEVKSDSYTAGAPGMVRTVQSGRPALATPSEVKSDSYTAGAFDVTYLSLVAIYQLTFAHLSKTVELAKHLTTLHSRGVISDSDMEEILLQHSVLEQRLDETEKHIGEIVVVYDRELFFGSDLNEAIEQVRLKYGSVQKRYYSETIGITTYPSVM